MESERINQAEITRSNIIACAAEEILHTGFQSASVSNILRKAGVSKGCFYHHFPTKKELGYAVLDELFTKVKTEIWEPILTSKNPLQAIINLYQQPKDHFDNDQIKHGCPINNLAQEMSPVDEGFRERIELIYSGWKQRLTEELQRCQQDGHMKKDINVDDIAALIIAATQGATGIAKNAQNPDSFIEYTRGLSDYLNTLQQ